MESDLSAILILKAETRQYMDARLVGRAIDRLGIAFEQYLRNNRDLRGRLVLERIEFSSVVAFLRDLIEVGGAALTLYEHRELLAGLVAQLGDALPILRNQSPGPVPAYLRNAIAALADPVARGAADRVTLSVHGDNNTILVIEKVDAEALRYLLQRPGSGGHGGVYLPEQPADVAITGWGKRGYGEGTYGHAEPVSDAEVAADMAVTTQAAQGGGVERRDTPVDPYGITGGKAAFVRDAWFVAPDSLPDAWQRMSNPQIMQGRSRDQIHRVEGRVEYTAGLPNGFFVTVIEQG